MITTQDVKNMVLFAEGNPEMMASLKNLNISDYWVDKYFDFENMLHSQYPALVKLWDIDLHCLRLYSRIAGEMTTSPGKAAMFKSLAEAHRDSILKDMSDISQILHDDYDDFFGLGY